MKHRSLCLLLALSTPLACADDVPEVQTTTEDSTGTEGTTSPTSTATMGTGTGTDTSDTTLDGTSTDATATGSTTEVGTESSSGSESGSGSGSESGSSSGSGSESGSSSGSTTMPTLDDTIYEIQDGTILAGADVDVQGVVVTGVGGSGFFAQEPPGGQYSGVYVYVGGAPGVAVGDEIDLLGTIEEFNDLTEINVTMGSVTPTGVTGLLLAPEVVPAAELAPATGEPWEGVLVRIEGAPLTVSGLPGFSEFDVNDGGAVDTRVDNFLYSVFDFPASFPSFGLGATFTAIQGPLNYTFGAFKLAPRDAMDFEGYMGVPGVGEPVDNLLPGDLVITEVMFDPTCVGDDCEWIEVHNTTGLDVDLLGLRVQDSTLSVMNQGTVSVNVLVPAGGYAWLARGSAGTWPYMASPDAYYGTNPAFNNTGDLVVILNAVEILDQTATYPTFGGADDGISWKLDPLMLDGLANDDALNWCFSTMVFESPGGTAEYGSPGAANEAACAVLP